MPSFKLVYVWNPINPESLKNNVKKLQGIKLYRLRIGNYRVVFDENLIVIEVVKIGLRGNVYNKINKLGR